MDIQYQHAISLLCNLNELRKAATLCDVEIKVVDVIFPVHRVLLCAASKYFEVMFCGGMAESFQHVVQLNGVSSDMVTILLDFIYTGKIAINAANVQELLAAAKMLQLDNVVEFCCEFLTKQLSSENSLGILLFADLHGCRSLYATALSYTQRNFMDVTQSEEFLQLSLETLLLFIKSDEIKITKEEDILIAVINWMCYDVSRCQTSVAVKVFLFIRFPLLNPETVSNDLKKFPDSKIKTNLYTLYQDVLKMQQLPENTLYIHRRPFAQQHFYIIGGYTGKSDTTWNGSVSLADVERFNASLENPGNNFISTTQLCPMNYPRNGLGIAVLGGLIYAIGGEDDSLIYDSVECYNPVLNKWDVVASMVYPRVGLGACVVENEIFVIGGWIGSEIARTIEKYNPEKNTWVVAGSIPNPRYNAGVCEMYGLVYVVGGMDECGEELQSCDVYDPIREIWTSNAAMHHKRSCLSLVSAHGFIYAIGGSTASIGVDIVEKYNVATNSWEDEEPLPSVRVSADAVHYESCIYVFGGRTLSYPPESLDSIVCYNTQNNKWYPFGKLNIKRSEAGVVIL